MGDDPFAGQGKKVKDEPKEDTPEPPQEPEKQPEKEEVHNTDPYAKYEEEYTKHEHMYKNGDEIQSKPIQED